ncbi:MAG: alpha/beta fold hydrolase [Marinobacter sp.]|uniref:alpha/beta fold hydrolase n=1 Tax=Marinobacter sp. TaxID=50741 RepID=UPI001B6BCD46|nr:alpha/beta fold hydrolase [Marinobacter sp.]MBQ0746954.1 alpha/beta fold hydrolase [Marinobacter sp.]MBQ0812675.1 alpha/beta fold hydrolase [Marinobacter sp.]|tara:strand:- start:4522 stop:5268 length:747 start_codon:yes stop_codon:yes gene_type:complete
MSFPRMAGRLVVVGGWGVRVEMLEGLYDFWPGTVELVSLNDSLIARCDSVADVADELLSRYPETSVWMGWSMGAQVVMEAASRHTGAVSVAITLAGFPKFIADERWLNGMSADEFGVFSRGLNRESERYWIHFMLLMISGAADGRAERQRLKIWLDQGSPVSPGNLMKSLNWLQQTDQRLLWSQVEVPVLHITGACDQVVATWAGALETPPATIEISIPGMAHWPGGVFAGDCRAVIETFFQSLSEKS